MKKIGVITSGGDAPGMNAALRAVVRTALGRGVEVMGFFHGFQGLVGDEPKPLDSKGVGGIIDRGGTILRTARCDAFKTAEGRQIAFGVLTKYDCEGLIVIGGDGSMTGALHLQKEHGVPVMGIPATIDNDIFGTDFSIGFDTAVNSALGAIDRIRDTATAHNRVLVIEVMGRYSGALAIEAGLAGGAEAILVPEVPFDLQKVVQALEANVGRGKRSAIIVVAEGAMHADQVMEFLEREAKFECRKDVLGYLQRGGSPTAFDRVLASRFAALATNRLIGGFQGEMTAINGSELLTQPLSYVLSRRREPDPEKLLLAQNLAN